MAKGVGLLRRAIKATGGVQEDFARLVFRCSRRTLVRMLAGVRPIEPERITQLRAILRGEAK